ncbi:hypothetical protein CH256_06555 [Rhodococcus sp. 05-2254-6]|nr:hypothetical protein A2J02_16075 [Rhodococcus sp. EPR-147]KZF11212.1 hypothetical protein A2J04_18995 [Rhodococcus sp. EPR-279]OZE31806.1 hypothetical protein CH259_27500 [Rhodococcus sp. 05-2254-4]OZE39497.1 hypothetical protein CH256_06555 [Rhodococcus sp. 05-2254-6]OZE42736.1 hypothetical protein CH261_21985 [Rhodococcus sp. 05-2254-3]OZE46894.1 hypothetical protein CH283_21650 [Rhodococcus sp. 05-2254-2]OZF43611.1 hypothetical protein CH291_24595 [Rhodococcus sp. 14-1411-2a]
MKRLRFVTDSLPDTSKPSGTNRSHSIEPEPTRGWHYVFKPDSSSFSRITMNRIAETMLLTITSSVSRGVEVIVRILRIE